MPTSRRALATAMTILPVLAVPAVYLLAAFTGPRLSDREFFIALAWMPWGVLPGYGLSGRMGRGAAVAVGITVGAAIAASVLAVVAIYVIGAWGLTLAAMVLYPVMVVFAAVWAAFDVATGPGPHPR
jgi:hypothetical protein